MSYYPIIESFNKLKNNNKSNLDKKNDSHYKTPFEKTVVRLYNILCTGGGDFPHIIGIAFLLTGIEE